MNLPLLKVVLVETITACTRSHWHCKYGIPRYKRTDKSTISFSTILKILKDLKSLNFAGRMSWFRINEPLLEPRIFEIISLSKKYIPRAYHTITTNGDLLDQTVCDDLLSCGLDHLVISVYNNDIIKKMDSIHTTLKITLKDRRNMHKWENRGGNIEMIDNAAIKFDCFRPSTALNIMPSGDVAFCCSDLFGDFIMGNVNQNTIESIWLNDKFEYYRKRLKECRNGLPLCEKCNHHGRGHEIVPN